MRYNEGMWQGASRSLWFAFTLLLSSFIFCGQVSAASLGAHVLAPGEIALVSEFFRESRENSPLYVTIPFTLDDIDRLSDWKSAFTQAKEQNVIPLVRLATRFNAEKQAWEVPTRRDVIRLTNALNTLEWPQNERYIILFNEPNHAKEWGGTVDPESFADISYFATQWLQTESAEYRVLPAAMDLAAPSGKNTMDALAFWRKAAAAQPEFLNQLYAWNSHSYPNPAFSAPPQRSGRQSLRGYQYELAFLKQFTKKDFTVFITETGWDASNVRGNLSAYYQYASTKIWNDDKVVAVTPFILRGAPGPFAGFSLMDENNQPTQQGKALLEVMVESQRDPVAQQAQSPTID